MFKFSLRQLFAISFVVVLLIPWWYRAIEIPFAPGFGQIVIPHRIVQARITENYPERDIYVCEIVCLTRSRLADGILNMPQAFYPILTGLVCGSVVGWLARGAIASRSLENS